tara:strand:- start:38 stop:307 length:270 start_codon:yes stop_codon:yes gene_type:complete
MDEKFNSEKNPSKFSVEPFATDDEIWEKILKLLTPLEKIEVDRSQSEINNPYMGGKEIILRRGDKSNIAVALLSEINEDRDEWAIYREI